ncbi:bacteriophage Gp15 family protein [Mycoplasmopsis felis]|uniref:bacteriophage Gp15 family protein n=1 Tax=Mycoplasmopsis felis TaxID=33923 RepID=UPI0021E0549E|nr:bacteriophage Gp15 family protein [Mycoplasmopsis felis]MCU9934748.1 bacteriophage Gp15 family protein [Mycoplasmopsis felis]
MVAAFKSEYNIEPADILKMKPSLFNAYLNNLPDKHTIIKIMLLIRTPDANLTMEQIKIKNIYKLNNAEIDPLEQFAIFVS